MVDAAAGWRIRTAGLAAAPSSAVLGGAGRRPELDWPRVGLFAGLILYHEGLIYAPWSPWIAKSVHRLPAVEPFLLLTHPWRMSLLFLVSGVATRQMAGKQSARALCAGRSLRLLPPLGFAFVVLVPIQGYLAMVENTPYAEGWPAFLHGYFSLDHTAAVQGLRYRLPVYGHLWFVFYLWSYTMALAAGLTLAPGLVRAVGDWLDRTVSGPVLLVWPIVGLVALRLTAYRAFGVTLGFTDDWYNHLVCGGFFLLGFLAARSERIWESVIRLRWVALAVAAAGYAADAVWAGRYGGVPELVELSHPAMSVFYELERWGAIVALLGFARRHLGGSAPLLAYLNGGVFTYYVLHQPAMLLALHWLKPMNLPPVLEAVLIAAATLAACGLGYELARRLPVVGVLLGCAPAKSRPFSVARQPAPDLGG